MKTYVYKIQWLCPLKEAIQLIKIIGRPPHLKINARDRYSFKIMKTYESFFAMGKGKLAIGSAIKWMKLEYQQNNDLIFEIYKK